MNSINNENSTNSLNIIFTALNYSAEMHKNQQRKDYKTPYINHPIAVAETLVKVGNVTTYIIAAALLHDVIEDTTSEPDAIKKLFGDTVLNYVLEVTDDKNLPKSERKLLQIKHAPHMSDGAKMIKLADHSSNVSDILNITDKKWDHNRRVEYLIWSQKVIAGVMGVNENLENYYKKNIQTIQVKLKQ